MSLWFLEKYRMFPGSITTRGLSMRCESHFNPSFGNVKAFNLKKLKLTLSPSPQWPQATLRLGATAGKFLRKTKGRTVFGKESFESIPETSRSRVETCPWAIWRGTMQFGGQFERRKPAPAQLTLWQASFFFSLACWPGRLPTCKVWRTQSKDPWN